MFPFRGPTASRISEIKTNNRSVVLEETAFQSTERPEWWKKNERLREEMGLPDYEPPMFSDGVFTHTIVPQLEEKHGCSIMFRSKQPCYPCQWEIHVDGRCVASTARRRTNAGNTIYQLSSTAFIGLIESALE
jgi:hypothetical protein